MLASVKAPGPSCPLPADKIAWMTAPHTASAATRFDADEALRLAHQTLDIEAAGVLGLKARLDERFAQAVKAILDCRGRTVVMGMGKSGHVARKIAATLASTGTPAMFVHPAEASHGDLGMITSADVVLALSNSGEVAELTVLLPLVRRIGAPLIAMTGGRTSSLARHADILLDSGVEQEACPLQLAPTASTTAQMALGDALAVALLDARGFAAEDFARSHPGGSLGRRLLTHVSDVMVSGDAVPTVRADAPFGELMREMSRKGLGLAAVVGENDELLGVFTDGDLRRLVETGADLRPLTAAGVMKPNPRRISPGALAADAAESMELNRITALLVAEPDGPLLGVVHIGELMRSKVV